MKTMTIRRCSSRIRRDIEVVDLGGNGFVAGFERFT